MSLTSALDAAKSSLATTSAQASIISRNIAGANDPGYARKFAVIQTGIDGVGYISSISRATNSSLLAKRLATSSTAASQDILSTAFTQISQTVGATGDASSISSKLSALNSSLLAAAANPSNAVTLQSAVQSASDVAATLNGASSAVRDIRNTADSDMVQSVGTINSLLGQFKTANDAVVRGNFSGADTSASMDARDKILMSLSSEIGISVVPGRDQGLAIYTDSGVTLFNKDARSVTLGASKPLPAGTSGQAVMIDGVDVTSKSAPMGIKSGKLAGLAAVRDVIAPQYQKQIDEIARGLVKSFSETAQSGAPGQPDQPGLFTWSGGPTMPGTGVTTGIAGSIRVNSAVDPSIGGNATLLRDGGISDPSGTAYQYNITGAAGYSARLQSLADAMTAAQPFDPAAGLDTSASVSTLATSLIGWVENGRQTATNLSVQQKAIRDQAAQALNSQTGVNIDDEMSRMLDIEHSYQASAKLISGIDSMFTSLFAAMG